eukprot:11254728-Ditylum_brightwellii.AAC.1
MAQSGHSQQKKSNNREMGSEQRDSNKAEPHNSDGPDSCYNYYKISSCTHKRKMRKLCRRRKCYENTGR